MNRTTDQTRTTANTTETQWTEHRHKEQTPPIGQPLSDRGGGSEVEVKELDDKP